MERFNKLLSRSRRLFVLMKLHMVGPTSALPYNVAQRTYMYQEINWL